VIDDITITDQQARALAARAQAGDRRARDQLFEACKPIVEIQKWHRMRQILRMWSDVRDFEQQGYLALLGAIHSFDPSSPRTFVGHAYARVQWAMSSLTLSEMRRGAVIGSNERRCSWRVLRIRARLCTELQREPTAAEIAAQPDFPASLRSKSPTLIARRIRDVLSVRDGQMLELDAPQLDDPRSDDVAEFVLYDDCSPEEIAIRKETCLLVRQALGKLCQPQRAALLQRFWVRDGRRLNTPPGIHTREADTAHNGLARLRAMPVLQELR
jgi:DNA-directed RNA polymerase sigma subunit (sigma70/sigma32)